MRRPARLVLTAALATAATLGLSAPAALLPTAGATAARVSGVRLNGFEARLAADINAARRSAGLRPLDVVPGTTDVARRWAWHLARAKGLSHNPRIVHDLQVAGSGNWHEIAENVGCGPADDPQALFHAYMQSPEHRANILDRGARYLGVGTVERDGIAWNTLDFTDAYGSRYGHVRVPAAGLTMDRTTVAPSTEIASLEGADQRFGSRARGAVHAGRVHFTGASARNGAAKVRFRDRRGHGHGSLLMRDALDLRHASHLRLQLAATDRRGRAVPVRIVLRRSFGGGTVLGTVHARRHARWVELALPEGTRDFQNTLVLRVGGHAVRHAGGSVRLALYDLRAAA